MPPSQLPHDAPGDSDPALAEALRRSLAQTTREESMLADALAASLESRDAELARQLQGQLDIADAFPGAVQDTDVSLLEAVAMNEAITESRTTQKEQHWTLVQKRRHTPSQIHGPIQRNPYAAMVAPVPGAPSQRQALGALHPSPGTLTQRQPRAALQSAHVSLPHRQTRAARPQRQQQAPQQLSVPTFHEQVVPSHLRSSGPVPAPAVASSMGPPAVVLDGLNVGCTLGGGGGSRFRARGVKIALDYYKARGVRAIALLPRNKVDSSISIHALADNVDLLLDLASEERVFFTPPGASDDNFILTYSIGKKADLVSNDRFRAELGRQKGRECHRAMKIFLRDHLIPFTFVLDEFLPNPNPAALTRGVHHGRVGRFRYT